MTSKARLPRATRRHGDVLLQSTQGLLWVRRNDSLVFVAAAERETGGWLVRQTYRTAEPAGRIAVADQDEASQAMTAVWRAFRWSFWRSAFLRGMAAGWISLIVILAAISPLRRPVLASATDLAVGSPALRAPLAAPPVSALPSAAPPAPLPSGQPGGAIDHMN